MEVEWKQMRELPKKLVLLVLVLNVAAQDRIQLACVKIVWPKTKTTSYLATYLGISKPMLYKYMRLIDPNWRHVYNMMPSRELILPECLKLLPLYTLTLTKSVGLRQDARVDERAYWLMRATSISASLGIPLVYPRKFSVHNIPKFLLQEYDNEPSILLNKMVNEIRRQSCSYLRLHLLKRVEMMFHSFIIEDKSGLGSSYVEFLVYVHRQIQVKMQPGS
ncbi:hypothetical protein SELMODRAFT_411850 [Selaginella moellendorffii]|uniref:Sec23/Sec24 helical domain-containing protein n=1 Tax=Selaginella moellendorffii TaxID=88036 RepID=D8RJ83_SELML|nr:hypothetical protein SELMODRAFT_411850 [Selaginella moellendorffii]